MMIRWKLIIKKRSLWMHCWSKISDDSEETCSFVLVIVFIGVNWLYGFRIIYDLQLMILFIVRWLFLESLLRFEWTCVTEWDILLDLREIFRSFSEKAALKLIVFVLKFHLEDFHMVKEKLWWNELISILFQKRDWKQ
jgi:hypothetical protein